MTLRKRIKELAERWGDDGAHGTELLKALRETTHQGRSSLTRTREREEAKRLPSVYCTCGAQWHGKYTQDNPNIESHRMRGGRCRVTVGQPLSDDAVGQTPSHPI